MENLIIKVFLIILVILEIIICINKKDKYKILTDDIIWLFVVWTICLLLYYYLGITYYISLSVQTLIYILIFWISYLLGKFFGKKILNLKIINRTIDENNIQQQFKTKLNLFPIFIISFFATMIYVVYILLINKISFGSTRNISTNAFATLLLLLSSSSLIIWLYELSYALLNEKKIRYYGWISAILYNIPCLLISGRDALIIYIVSTAIVLIYCGKYSKKKLINKGEVYKKIKTIICFIGIFFMIYLVFLTGNRYGKDDESALKMFSWSANCEFPEYIKDIYYQKGGIGKVIVNGLFYYSSQFSKLELIVTSYDGPYLYGFFQLHYISRLLPTSFGMNYSIVENKISRLTYERKSPGLKKFWDTIIGYYIYDFGKIGALMAIFITGIIIKSIQVKYEKQESIYGILVNTFICVGTFMTVEISPIYDYYYIFPVIWLILLIKIKKKKRGVK